MIFIIFLFLLSLKNILYVYMFKNKTICYVMSISFFVPFLVPFVIPLNALRVFLDNYKEYEAVFYEVS